MEKIVSRNQFVDIMRGIAMLCVVLQHTMSGSTVGAEKSFIFNIVWSFQLPLFILISGYVTKYSRGIHDTKGLWKYVKSQIRLFRYMENNGVISLGEYWVQSSIRMCAAMIPNCMRKLIFKNILRNGIK